MFAFAYYNSKDRDNYDIIQRNYPGTIYITLRFNKNWMEHYFELPVIYKGEEHNFKGRLATFGYVYKFYIVTDGRELVFEKDDEQQYRVLVEGEERDKPVDAELMQAIIEALNKI